MKVTVSNDNKGDNFIDFESVFTALNKELTQARIMLELVCAGGYVMQLNGYRATADIDAFFKSTAEIESIIRKVGDTFGINKPDELWLNNSISNMNPEPPDEYCKVLYQFSNLTVKTVDIGYLIGMKLTVARGQDLKDVAEIVKDCKDYEPFKLLSMLSDMKFDIDISILLDTFEMAFGMEWLEKFYKEHEAQLREYF